MVQQTVTQTADGSTVLQNSADMPDGQLAEQITTTTSANGLDRTNAYDWNGDGIVDQNVAFKPEIVFIKWIGTHAEYEKL